MPPLGLYIRVYTFRFLQFIGRYCDHYLSLPLPFSYTFTREVRNTTGTKPGTFSIYFYTPKEYREPFTSSSSNPSTAVLIPQEKHPLIVNFHGGGYTIGHATDDSRLFTTILNTTTLSPAPLITSVNYRLAPENPFPTGIEDCVSSILYLWTNSSTLQIDTARTILTGFSAGGNFCFGVAYRLHSEVEKLKARGETNPGILNGKLVGIIAVYPAVDWTPSRLLRNMSNPNFKPLSPFISFAIFEEAYFYWFRRNGVLIDRRDMLLSPGLAEEEVLKKALPERVAIYTCGRDGLLVEGETFRERLVEVGKTVGGYMVEGVSHGWDKWPSWWWGEGKRDRMYADIGKDVEEMFA